MGLVLYGDLIRDTEFALLDRKDQGDLREQVKVALNQGQRYIARKFPWTYLEAYWTVPATDDSPNYYSYPDGLMAPLSLRIRTGAGVTGRPLVSRPINQIDLSNPDQTKQGTPEFVSFTGKNLLLTKGFTTTEATGATLLLRGLQSPPEMVNDDDVSLFPDAFAEVIRNAAIMEMADWLWNDAGQVQRWERRTLEGIREMRQMDMGDLDHQDEVLLSDGLRAMLIDSGNAGRFD